MHEAMTIHRLLEYNIQDGFARRANNPLDTDLIIADEASMIDTSLLYHLLDALPAHAHLVLVGDPDQLPSVGPGRILGDLIASNRIRVVKLDQIFRQEKGSQIIVNAHMINKGSMPSEQGEDFFFIKREKDTEVLDTIIKMVQQAIPEKYGLDPVNDIQVISPIHKGVLGVVNLNKRLQTVLNPGAREIRPGFRINDKVMQMKNNYPKDVYNGDIGRITQADDAAGRAVVTFDSCDVVYEYSEMHELSCAYAITVHKSQGAEYPVVVMPVVSGHHVMLRRNLMYTAVSRARRLVVMVGSETALSVAVENRRTGKRFTRLEGLLKKGTS